MVLVDILKVREENRKRKRLNTLSVERMSMAIPSMPQTLNIQQNQPQNNASVMLSVLDTDKIVKRTIEILSEGREGIDWNYDWEKFNPDNPGATPKKIREGFEPAIKDKRILNWLVSKLQIYISPNLLMSNPEDAKRETFLIGCNLAEELILTWYEERLEMRGPLYKSIIDQTANALFYALRSAVNDGNAFSNKAFLSKTSQELITRDLSPQQAQNPVGYSLLPRR